MQKIVCSTFLHRSPLFQSNYQNFNIFQSTKLHLAASCLQQKHPGKKITKMSSSGVTLNAIPKVDIDKSGVFKYILINVTDKSKQEESPVTIVRGYAHCNYHSDILDEVESKLQPLQCEVLGGGRISHDADFKRIKIYGYSQGFGKADHEVTANIIKDAYPNYTITISDEGY
ncbi:PREDICTED: 14 kDa phosphohistidine phosphatase-like isoform X2 [Papilio polytes]|uniref:14 kDa phosphohistidine phosphatase-like isoform X2 n=1 Tax=Papilio polytes TaxID=76194 RepID=UPI00067680C0|nr:PREDICTED: 14 kDa phosphohistidine phosphatase-like isoform X2 [Papilio polytes]